MKVVKVSLNTIDKVKEFVKLASSIDCEMDLVSGRYVIDAKSIMGIFSMDLCKTLNLHIHSENEDIVNKFSNFFAT